LQAVDLCRDNELYEDLCRSLIALGSLKHRQGDCAAALQDIEESLKVAKRLAAEEKTALIGDALTAQAEVRIYWK
jgi:ATP/maltotriose-dependent transcriptional regulator MalT